MSQLTIEESIKRLKAEIIAQDWRISPKRTEMIETALLCLQQHFQERKATHAMLIMALSVLDYIRKKGSNPPETVDFLKETMANVVGQYEDLEYSPLREEEIFRSLFAHFSKLKELIKTGRKPVPKKPNPAPLAQPAIVKEPSGPPAQQPKPENTQKIDRINLLESVEAEKLINDLRKSLEKAGEVGSTIGELLGQLIASQQTNAMAQLTSPHGMLPRPTHTNTFKTTETWQESPTEKIQGQNGPDPYSKNGIKSCPPTELRQLIIGSTKLAVQESLIAAIKPLTPSRMQKCIQKSYVPAKDFGSLLHSLSGQFKGPLGRLKSNKLKKINLPIMVPQGMDLPETPDPRAQNILVLSNGSWHGIIVCEKIKPHPQNMIKFEKKQNGDIAGKGYLENEEEILLLDSLSILRREGFLVIPG